MSIDTNWNIDKYYDSTLPRHQWLLQKIFIENYKEQYPEDQLVSLSQCYINVHFLGSRYSEPTMTLLNSLISNAPTLNKYNHDLTFQSAFIKDAYQTPCAIESKDIQISHEFTKKRKALPLLECKKRKFNEKCTTSRSIVNAVQAQEGIKGKIILFTNDPENMNISDLHCAAQNINERVIIQEVQNTKQLPNNKAMYEVLIGNEIICSDIVNKTDQKSIKQQMALKAINILKDYCFTIQKLTRNDGIQKNNVYEPSTVNENSNNKLSDDNCSIGAKLMKQMGWSGRGLGLNEQGMEDIINVDDLHINKAGFGNTKIPRALEDLIKKYAKEDNIQNLVFSSEFTKEERAQIHMLAKRFGLKSNSSGSGSNRKITLSRKTQKWSLIALLIENNNETLDYKLLYPKKFDSFSLAFI